MFPDSPLSSAPSAVMLLNLLFLAPRVGMDTSLLLLYVPVEHGIQGHMQSAIYPGWWRENGQAALLPHHHHHHHWGGGLPNLLLPECSPTGHPPTHLLSI